MSEMRMIEKFAAERRRNMDAFREAIRTACRAVENLDPDEVALILREVADEIKAEGTRVSHQPEQTGDTHQD